VSLKQQITNIQSDSPSGAADAAWFRQVIDFQWRSWTGNRRS
jgi:hypothetical protein